MALKVYVFMTVVLYKSRIPRMKQYCGTIWIVFYGYYEALCPLPKAGLRLS
jgi:hypothetical protein